MKISVVLPVFNEEKNIPILYGELTDVLKELNVEYEVIAVNDGSRDQSNVVLNDIALRDFKFKVIDFKFNTGQTAALAAGINHAKGDLIILMDADLQNDPADIPRLIKKMDEGFDVVSGWRKGRWKGQFLSRKVPSYLANHIISLLTKVHLHDFGCVMKLYKREFIEDISLYGEMHRYIPVYVAWRGARIAEIAINDRERKHGFSNYGMNRVLKVPLDLMVVSFFWGKKKPMYFFGYLGYMSLFIGCIAGVISVILKLLEIRDFVATPLPILAALFIIVGIQLIMMGLIAELLMRTYYESQQRNPYIIGKKINL